MQLTWRGLEKFCQVMFCCGHFHCVRIEPHRKRMCIEFLTTQTDQSKCDILIDYVPNKYMHVPTVTENELACSIWKEIVRMMEESSAGKYKHRLH